MRTVFGLLEFAPRVRDLKETALIPGLDSSSDDSELSSDDRESDSVFAGCLLSVRMSGKLRIDRVLVGGPFSLLATFGPFVLFGKPRLGRGARC